MDKAIPVQVPKTAEPVPATPADGDTSKATEIPK